MSASEFLEPGNNLEQLERLWESKRDPRYLPALVEALVKKGSEERALNLCLETLESGEGFLTLRLLAGGLLLSFGRYREAEENLAKVLEADPHNREAVRLLETIEALRVSRSRSTEVCQKDSEPTGTIQRIRDIVASIGE